MKLYLILLPVLYLIVSYISIFKMHSVITRILRIVMGILLLFVVALTTLQFPKENWWVFVVLLLLVGNVEVTGFNICYIYYFNFYTILKNKNDLGKYNHLT